MGEEGKGLERGLRKEQTGRHIYFRVLKQERIEWSTIEIQ